MHQITEAPEAVEWTVRVFDNVDRFDEVSANDGTSANVYTRAVARCVELVLVANVNVRKAVADRGTTRVTTTMI